MKEKFDRHQKRLTDAEDRRVWQAMHDEIKKRRPAWKRWGVPLSAFATLTTAVVVVALVNQGGIEPMRADEVLAGRTAAGVVSSETDLDNRTAPEEGNAETPDVAHLEPGAAAPSAAARSVLAEKNVLRASGADEKPAVAVAVEDRANEPVTPADKPRTRDLVEQRKRSLRVNPVEERIERAAGAPAPAGGTLQGRITASDGTPISFANAVLVGTRMGAITDSLGVFTIENLPAGSYRLRVSFLGYDAVEQDVKVGAGDDLAMDLSLTETAFARAGGPDDYRDASRPEGDPARFQVESRVGDLLVAGKEQERRLDADGKLNKDKNARTESTDQLAAQNETPKPSGEAGKIAGGSHVGVIGGAQRYGAAQTLDAGRGSRAAAPETKPLPPRREPISVGGTDPVNGRTFDAMFFEHYGVNPFVDPQDDRFATFAMDVDNASYSLARSYLNRGVLPPKDAIRVEEFVNTFDHNYAPPRSGLVADRRWAPSEHGTFAIHLDAAPSPFGKDLVLMRVGLKGREIDVRDRKPAVLTFVVDVSGSMGREDRLGLVKRALTLLLDQMNQEDSVGLVVYGSNARTILDPTPLRHRRDIERAIASLQPEGATNAEAGLRVGYAMADRSYQRGCINRVILCSDGVANVGQTGADGILQVIKREAGRGIELTAVGFGMGNYNDVLMEKLADQGDGNYYYVDDIDEARRVFVENLTGTLQTIAKQAKIQVEFDPDAVRRYRLLGYENRDVADKDFRNDTIDAGEVGAGHEVTALFEVKLERDAGRRDLGTVRIRYEDPETGRVTEEARTLKVRDVAARLRDADPTLRMDAAVAEFSEILRHSYWAKDGDLSRTLGLARDAARELGSPEDLQEMVQLVESAWRLWPREAPPTWRDDVRPSWEPEDDDPRR